MINPEAMPARLETFLQLKYPAAGQIAVQNYSPMTGGYSRLMASFTARIDGAEHRLVVRGDPPPEAMYIETDRTLEWEILSALDRAAPGTAPHVFGYDPVGDMLGTKAIVMEMVGDGTSLLSVLRRDDGLTKTGALTAYCDLAARIHAVDLAALPAGLDRPTDWNGYIDTLIAQWGITEAEHCETDPFFRYMAAWLDANRPPPAPFVLVHGELQPSNIVVSGNHHLTGVDWELTHIGDPREDFGWCKFVGSVQPPDIIGIDDTGFCALYREKTGLGPEIINPLTIGYFSILSSIRMFRQVLGQHRAFVDGSNTSLRPAYTTLAFITAHEQWYRATQAIEAATKSLQEHRP